MKRSVLVPRLLFGLSLVPLAVAPILFAMGGCSNHDALAPTTAATTATHSSTASTVAATSGGTGGAAPIEPDGPTRLTLVNAVVDAPAIGFCFSSYPDGAAPNVPFPAAGLAFGNARVVALPSTDIPTDDALLTIVSGDLSSIGTSTCADIISNMAAFPSLVVTPLGVLPASTLTAKRSVLLAPMGCIGGATHVDPNQEAVCGKGYTPDTPTINLLGGALSRLDDPSRIAIQGVNAIVAIPKADFYVQPGFSGFTAMPLAQKLPLGGVGPFPPYDSITAATLGSIATAELGIAPNPSVSPLPKQTTFSDALTSGGVPPTDVVNGKGFAVIACGASPGAASGSWWNDFKFLIVDSDPGS